MAETQTAERKGAASASDFGAELAAVARRQTSHLVFYNPAYMKISYPMGDVPAYFGVCTDVVVRAYRALGIDLQVWYVGRLLGLTQQRPSPRRVAAPFLCQSRD